MSDTTELLLEGQDLIETYSRVLFELEDQLREAKEPDPDQINESFRSVHTLKGLAALAGNKPLEDFAHRFEEALDALRLGKAHLDVALLNILFEAVGGFELLLRREPFDVETLLARLELELAESAGPSAADPLDWLAEEIRSVLTEFEEHRLRANVELGRPLYLIKVEFDLMTVADDIESVRAKLKQDGEVISFMVSADSSDPDCMAFSVLVGSSLSEHDLAALVTEHGGRVERLRGGPEPAPADVPIREPEPALAAANRQTVRVNLGRLDLLMNLVGELSLIHTNLRSLSARSSERQLGVQLRELETQLLAMNRRLGELQQGILDVRMVPVRPIFEQTKRSALRGSSTLEKEVRVSVEGADTELDKQIGEKLSSPLVHLVNNAIAHGIEDPAERVALGKPRVGNVILRAYQQGNRVIVEVSDDGRGIDWRTIRDKARQKGFITGAEAASIDAARAINLIFTAGFSSRDEADTIAGRGVGMDVVKTEIAELSGLIDVATEPGKGSRFRITLPSTLAIIQALVVESAGQIFCIQLNSVLESLMIHPRDIQTVEGHEVTSMRGRTLPLIHLARVFELEPREAPRSARARARAQHLYIVVIGLAQHRVGLVVDELLGQQDVVLKPIGAALSRIPGIAGATELGDNRTVLLLDVATLVSEAVDGIEAVVAEASTGQQGIRVSTRLQS